MGESGNRPGRWRLLVAGLVFYAVAGILSAAAARAFPRIFGFAAFPADARSWAVSVLAGAAVAAILIIASWLLVFFSASGRRMASVLASATKELSPAGALVLAVMAGVSEELVFRGALWSLVESMVGRWWAFGVTSVLFAAVHGLFRRGLVLWGLFALAGGLAAGGLYMMTGSLVAPVAMHVIVDAVNLPALVMRGGAGRRQAQES
ncbi:MAG TPA: CPBP family intramembrane metalloprotease [Myxococcota bacterium]|nr:CPBP family intramembrane metalloprotease [Myxococcota bacterium]